MKTAFAVASLIATILVPAGAALAADAPFREVDWFVKDDGQYCNLDFDPAYTAGHLLAGYTASDGMTFVFVTDDPRIEATRQQFNLNFTRPYRDGDVGNAGLHQWGDYWKTAEGAKFFKLSSFRGILDKLDSYGRVSVSFRFEEGGYEKLLQVSTPASSAVFDRFAACQE